MPSIFTKTSTNHPSRKLPPRRLVFALIVGSLVLPIALALVLATGRMLEAMGDHAGGRVLDRISLGLGLVWAIDLVSLVTALGVRSLDADGGARDDHLDERLD